MKTKCSLLLLVVALAVGYSPAAADMLKCYGEITVPGYEPRTPVILVDGEVWPHSLAEFGAGKVDVASIDITCWHPETGTFSSTPGVSLLIAKTKTFVQSPELMAAHDAEARKAMQELWDEATGGFGGWTERQ